MDEVEVQMRTTFFVEPNRVRLPSVAKPLVAVQISPVKTIEHVPEAKGERPVLIGLELEVERIIHPKRMNRFRGVILKAAGNPLWLGLCWWSTFSSTHLGRT